MVSSRDRDYEGHRIVDLLTNRELASYSQSPLRNLSIINGFPPAELQRETADMNEWASARKAFNDRSKALFETCAP